MTTHLPITVGRDSRDTRAARAARSARAAVALALLLPLASCVTETTTPPRGVRVTPDGTRGQRSASSAGSSATVALPDGPVAAPASAATLASRVRIVVRPLGTIPYDGLTLPISSPDGRFIATQVGTPPDWPAILALLDAQPPLSTIEAYALDAAPNPAAPNPSAPARGPGTTRIDWPDALPSNLILGRAADDEGFLVERIEPDATRSIAKVAWATGRVETLAQTPGEVLAHATLTSRGELLFTARLAVGAPLDQSPTGDSGPNAAATPPPASDAPDAIDALGPAVLRMRAPDGTLSTRAVPDGAYAFPLATADDRFVYALAVRTPALGARTASLELHAIRVDRRSSPRLGAVAWSLRLGDATSALTLSQIAAAVQPGPLARGVSATGQPAAADPLAPLTIFRPASARVHAIDLDRARALPLPATTVAAAWLNPARFSTPERTLPGFLCTTAEGLLFVPDPRRASGRVTPIRLLSGAYVARPTRLAEEFILLGPVANAPDRIDIVRARVGGPDQPTPAP